MPGRAVVARSSAETFLDDPAGALDALAEAGRVSFPHLAAARAFTAEKVAEYSARMAGVDTHDRMSIVLFGSWARGELTEHSDEDWALLVTHGFDPDDAEVADVQRRAGVVLGVEERRPGSQAVFGVPFSCAELVDHIGLDEDSNTNLTRRMLLLLESSALVDGDAYRECWDRVLGEYLGYETRDHSPPRFLLNDLVRYWRTICVDFEGKRRDATGHDPKYAERNAKLRTSRKMLFAGGLLPVMLCHLKEAAEIPGFLTRQFASPPTDRLAAAFLQQGAVAEGVRAILAYDRWIAVLQDRAAREELSHLRAGTREGSSLFREIREIGDELQRGLLALLYETGLSPLTRQYGLF
jgi:predicted nucleotidyltransferase